MKGLAKRLDQLEAGKGDLSLAHLTDDELRDRIVEIYGALAGHGLVLPGDWQEQLDADPMGFHRKMTPAMEAMLCED